MAHYYIRYIFRESDAVLPVICSLPAIFMRSASRSGSLPMIATGNALERIAMRLP
jgi:hypothetical protein